MFAQVMMVKSMVFMNAPSHIFPVFAVILRDIRVAMARMCHMSENYFSRMFGRLTGRTFPGYVTDLRLTKAKELLLEGDVKIGRVAYEVGYDDPAYFVRKFKAHTGMTPSEWQKYKQSEK